MIYCNYIQVSVLQACALLLLHLHALTRKQTHSQPARSGRLHASVLAFFLSVYISYLCIFLSLYTCLDFTADAALCSTSRYTTEAGNPPIDCSNSFQFYDYFYMYLKIVNVLLVDERFLCS